MKVIIEFPKDGSSPMAQDLIQLIKEWDAKGRIGIISITTIEKIK